MRVLVQMDGGNLSIIEASRLEYTENKGEDAVHGILICEMGSEERYLVKDVSKADYNEICKTCVTNTHMDFVRYGKCVPFIETPCDPYFYSRRRGGAPCDSYLKKTSGFTVEVSPGRSESNYCKNNFYTSPYKHRGPAN